MVSNKNTRRGLIFHRYFTKDGVHPYDKMEWDKRHSIIYDEEGNTVFEQDNIEVPKSWSQLATDIVASKYFRKAGLGLSKKEGETSVKQLINRVVKTIRTVGEERGGYFLTNKDADNFESDLTHILVNQMAAFNSPVWFNCGLYHEYGIKGNSANYHWDPKKQKVVPTDNAYEHPQNSACFILKVEDSLDSMLALQESEVKIFKYGSGAGSNFSKIRGKSEKLSGGGASSGVISFLEGFDQWAGCIKSGGTTRRAAKMVLLDMDHPEILDYIEWKSREEKKALTLINAGYPADFNGEAYSTVSGQNSNNSVRIPDSFMEAYLADGTWETRYRTKDEVAQKYSARFLMHKIAKEAHSCADPGVQFDDTIQKWHTCKHTDRINASNPCSEYLFLDDSACNLASLNLVKFLKEDNTFDIEAFSVAIRHLITAMDIIVDFSSYPTEEIAKNSYDYRPLGLGYANLGALCMILGYPYDSSQARAFAAYISSIMSGYGYKTSTELAATLGYFNKYDNAKGGSDQNSYSMRDVMEMHSQATFRLGERTAPDYLKEHARKLWISVLENGRNYGYRNSQISVIAPTGTIALLMDCDTTGIEPEFSLIKFKKLAGGGYMKIVNNTVRRSLKNLGYTKEERDAIITYLIGTGSLKDAPHINPESLKERGLLDDEIDKIEEIMPQSFTLTLAFSLGFFDNDILSRLGFDSKNIDKGSFDLLASLGFSRKEINEAETHICGKGTVEGAPYLKEEHYRIFDCAIPSNEDGSNYIRYMGALELMEAVQPFISGAISKTVNLPRNVTVKEIENLYVEAWKRGIKCLAVYRDGSKGSQPLSNQKSFEEEELKEETSENISNFTEPEQMKRKKLPITRNALAHKFSVDGVEGYLHVGFYEDGKPGEVFIRISKEGSTISGMLDTIATLVSISLQNGVPLETLADKFIGMKFEPHGFTENEEIPIADSIIDYIFKFLKKELVGKRKE